MDKPWLLSKDEIEIMEIISLEVVGEDNECYKVEFHDEDNFSIVEANILKEHFKNIPHSIEEGVCVQLVSFRYHDEVFFKVCPVMHYWSELWKTEEDE